MHLQFIVFSNEQTGQGHYFRCEALAKAALEAGHQITLLGDRKFPFIPQQDFRSWSYRFFKAWNERDHLVTTDSDWLVVDLPFNLSNQPKVKTCILNGIGYSLEYSHNLIVIQGLIDEPMPKNVVSGVEYVILRPELGDWKKENHKAEWAKWFVWGGSEDIMNLIPSFPVMPGGALFLHSTNKYEGKYFKVSGDSLLLAMRDYHRACVAMGMVVWELIYFDIPTWVFSATETHLKFAKALHDKDLINAWDGVGLPSQEEMKQFLNRPFEIDQSQEKPDLLATQRILKLLEERL
jgi:spore coat polysaccharide biosynthesis predicted glycosyltransferase SpsG